MNFDVWYIYPYLLIRKINKSLAMKANAASKHENLFQGKLQNPDR